MRTKIPLNEYIGGTPKVPRICMADAYTAGSGPHMSQDAKDSAVFQLIARKAPKYFFTKDDRLIFHGLRRIVRDLFTQPVTHAEIDSALIFLRHAHAGGTEYSIDEGMWRNIVDHFDGRIPLNIEAMKDGQVFFPFEPCIQLTVPQEMNLGNLAVWFESKILHVWATTERVTTARWWYEYLYSSCKASHPSWNDDKIHSAIKYMLHDFGDRAAICQQESEVLGTAHLVSGFAGTDTFSAGYLDYMETRDSWAESIHAGAHWSVSTFEKEMDFHEALNTLGKIKGITAHVSDTNNYYSMVDTLCEKMANEWKDNNNVIVIRPDSGDPSRCVLHVLRMCEKYNLFTEDVDGLKISTRIRWIQGDGMGWESMRDIMTDVIAAGWSPFGSGAFGVGGGLRNGLARDNTGMSLKAAECGTGDLIRAVAKRSETPEKSWGGGKIVVIDNYGDRSKNTVYLDNGINSIYNMLELWYNGPQEELKLRYREPCLETNSVTRERVKEDFLRRVQPDVVVNKQLLKIRERVINDHSI